MYLSIDKYPDCNRDLSGKCLLWGFSLDKASNFTWAKPCVDCVLGDLWNKQVCMSKWGYIINENENETENGKYIT